VRSAKQNRKHIEDNETNFCALALPPAAGKIGKSGPGELKFKHVEFSSFSARKVGNKFAAATRLLKMPHNLLHEGQMQSASRLKLTNYWFIKDFHEIYGTFIMLLSYVHKNFPLNEQSLFSLWV